MFQAVAFIIPFSHAQSRKLRKSQTITILHLNSGSQTFMPRVHFKSSPTFIYYIPN